MSVNLEQFHQVFFEESFEGLDVMESSLMELNPDAIDSETINAIFRSAHSIKGGSATFGFNSIAEFTHVLETLLDQVRADKRGLSPSDIDLLLQSVDCMRDMLGLLQGGDDGHTDQANDLKQKFEQILSGDQASAVAQSTKPQSVSSEPSGKAVWNIHFAPHEDIFTTGNDPLRQLQELNDLGEMEVRCNAQALPKHSSLDPQKCFLAWDISLCTESSLADIEEVFDWVIDDCDLSIDRAATVASDAASTWQIEFVPGKDILRTGNEPQRLFNALAHLGTLKVEARVDKLPPLQDLNGEECFLSWNLTLQSGSASREDIDEVFEWVCDDAEITIQKIEAEPVVEVATSTAQTQKAEQAANTEVAKKPQKKASPENSSIRVGIDKVDNLINMVGELVITQSMLGQLGTEYELDRVPKLMEGLSQLEQNTRELQESVMKIRMLPISFAFSRFPRMVRDLGQRLGKSVNLEMQGEQTELDKTVMEKIGDPLVHLVRNAVDHGIESPDERRAKGKDPTGNVVLNAYHQSGNVVIEIVDDGKGLDKNAILEKAISKNVIQEKDAQFLSDEQIFDLIFQPGFSTAKNVSDVSGRGVGMDVVKRNIQALNGVVELSSQVDKGSKITIKLPLTLAILDGQLVRVGKQIYVFPLVSIIESMLCREENVNNIGGGCNVFKLRDDYVPIIELHKSFSIKPDSYDLDESLLVVVECDGEKVGIVVDELMAQQQVVIKSLEQNYRRVEGVSGATILGDGTVALILDIPGIIKLSSEQNGVNTLTLGHAFAASNVEASKASMAS